jgi:phenylacetate-CoA ligase
MKPNDDFIEISPPTDVRTVADRRARNPLITPAGLENLLRVQRHPAAPVWNFETGDRIERSDLVALDRFREALATERRAWKPTPPAAIREWVTRYRDRSAAFSRRLPPGIDLERDWAGIPPMTRADLAGRIGEVVPRDADLSRLIVYDTSGTTGHAVAVPHHPLALACVQAAMETVMERYGVRPAFSPTMTGCINIGAQALSVVFPNVMTVWREAGFAKVNLHPAFWRRSGDADRFFREMDPAIITGDPVAFAEMIRWGIAVSPKILFSTALTLPGSVRETLTAHAMAWVPVVDWYSVSETGPIGYTCRENAGFHVLPPDIFVEIIDEDGRPLPAGERGEIAVTGGRNPYLPLLRYRTGDRGRIDPTPCPCGDPTPRIRDLGGRDPVLFVDGDGAPVNPVDVGRLLRPVAFFRYRMVQRADRSVDLTLQPSRPGGIDSQRIVDTLGSLFGPGIEIRVRIDPEMADDLDHATYRTELGPADELL